MSSPPPAASDPLLARFLRAVSREERDEEIEDLVATHALPVATAILRSRLARMGIYDREVVADLEGDVVVRLLHRLRRLAEEPDAPIARWADYVAVVAYHRFDDFVRAARPARAALTNRIRYALRHDTELALWQESAGTLCAGLARWRGSNVALLHGDLGPHVDATDLRRLELRGLLAGLFERLGRPVELSALVALVADLLQVHEPRSDSAAVAGLAARQRHPLEQLEQLEHLRRLWREIGELPVRQRRALLLNLRDPQGESVAWLLPVTGVARLAEIAAVLELPDEQFVELWRELPVEDLRIAELLGLTRQQVINLRKSARERLARRLGRVG